MSFFGMAHMTTQSEKSAAVAGFDFDTFGKWRASRAFFENSPPTRKR